MPNSLLVTGGTGTFGQAFVKYLLTHTKTQRIVIYSRGEHAQAALREQIAHLGGDSRVRYMVGDVRDQERLKRACRGVEVIIHAAALKRIETGAYNPDEMVKTNVIGTMNVVEAALANQVKSVVGLSSDKAHQPISPYGQSKALGESLLLAGNSMHGTRGPKFAAVRYGNIWKAQGSVVPKWLAAIARGERELQATDPSCTRFYMTVDQAVQLVWDAIGSTGLVIPDYLPAYQLGDLARAFVDEYGVVVRFHPLPEWEKLHESMREGLSSCNVRQMSIKELREALLEEGGGG